jgi:Uma2 family endonuclease
MARRTSSPLTAAEYGKRVGSAAPGELWDGASVVGDPLMGMGGVVASRLHLALGRHVAERGLGWTPVGELGFLVQRDPDRVLVPGASYVSIERLPVPPDDAFWPCAPDFVVEIASPTDRWGHVVAKCDVWLSHGSRVAWAVDPRARKVLELLPGEPAQEVVPGEDASAAPALPDFSMPVADLFR